MEIEDMLQGMNEIDKGLLEQRRKEIDEERAQRADSERNKALKLQLAELKDKYGTGKERGTALQESLAKEETTRKEQQEKDTEQVRGAGKYVVKFAL